MSKSDLAVSKDLVVSLDYVLQLEDGEEVDRSDQGDPLQFLFGHGQIISGLENALLGMAVGDEKRVVVKPADGYGEYDPENNQTLPRDAFPDDLPLEEGLGLQFRDRQSGRPIVGYVDEIGSDGVVIDFNHPLAGETLHFQVKITGLRQATAQELTHGHVHGPGQAH